MFAVAALSVSVLTLASILGYLMITDNKTTNATIDDITVNPFLKPQLTINSNQFNPNQINLIGDNKSDDLSLYYKFFTPTQGEIWPKAQNDLKLMTFYTYTPKCHIKVVNVNCPILVRAILRYIEGMKKISDLVLNNPKPEKTYLNKGKMEYLLINVTSPCEPFPLPDMIEKYVLSITEIARLNAESVWGAIRGLESLMQLFYLTDDYSEIRINATHVTDFPTYIHRGLLLDTARHFISVENILKTLDFMAMNKMNVFHWHIVDDESFPYESQAFPELSERGAFDPFMVYSKDQIASVVEYARDRGIRVYPEFAVPGRTQSWAVSHPEVSVSCFPPGKSTKKSYLLNPLKKDTYKLMFNLYREVQTDFKDKYFHLGGDQFEGHCWTMNSVIKAYFDKTQSTPDDLYVHFMKKTLVMLGNKNVPVVWEEVFDALPELSEKVIVAVNKLGWVDKMAKILNGSHSLILTAPYHLTDLDLTFSDLYYQAPRTMLLYTIPRHKMNRILGGEACVWSQYVDNNNLMTVTWPRAIAVAEVLWSGPEGDAPDKDTLLRAQEQIVRMRRLGVKLGDFY